MNQKKMHSFSILVVDDEETMRRTLSELLRLEGYQVSTARDGDEAIRKFQNVLAGEDSFPFDLVLLDLKMPGRDGLDVLRYIAGAAPDTQVILLTAHGSLQSAIEALRYGAQDYILKPASPEDIIRSIKRGLEQRAERRHREALLSQLESSIHSLRGETRQFPGRNTVKIHGSGFPQKEPAIIQICEGIRADLDRRVIQSDTVVVMLTPTEGQLFKLLAQNPGNVFSYRELVVNIQGYEVTHNEASELIRPLVSRLRRKLAAFPNGDHWIINVRAQGYIFEPPHSP